MLADWTFGGQSAVYAIVICCSASRRYLAKYHVHSSSAALILVLVLVLVLVKYFLHLYIYNSEPHATQGLDEPAALRSRSKTNNPSK